MPNIMITQRCNLNCEYCFANDFVNRSPFDTDITIKDFKKILDFILGDGTVKQIGIIGGEPLLHEHFSDILEILDSDNRLEGVTIYTNGILIKKYIRQLKNKKFHLLINCNDLNKKNGLIDDFLDSIMLAKKNLSSRIVFGLNYYKKGFDYSFLWKLLDGYNEDRIRVSISVPNKVDYNYSPLDYFSEIKNEVLTFFEQLKERGLIPYLDCNLFPACLITYEDWMRFDSWGADNPLLILKSGSTVCTPVIDITKDYTAVRCFGLSEVSKVDIRDFASISDLNNYYIRTIDAYAINSTYDTKCDTCYKYKTMKCSGGCLVYKVNDICRKRESERRLR